MRRIVIPALAWALVILPLACRNGDGSGPGGTAGTSVPAPEARSDQGPPWNERILERERMVLDQIEKRGVSDPRVLAAMSIVPRHLFVPLWSQSRAYADSAMSIGEGQTISQPYIVALMTELMELEGGEKVLEVGTGSGYQAAVLAEVVGRGAPGAGKVFTIEIVEPLARSSKALLEDLGYGNITFRLGDGYQGWPSEEPFDAIMVTAAPEHIPRPLLEQLAEGGRLVIPVGGYFQELVRITRKGNAFVKESVIPVRFVPMTGEALERDE